MNRKVFLESKEFGLEYFAETETSHPAILLPELERLTQDARKETRRDGIIRRVGIEVSR